MRKHYYGHRTRLVKRVLRHLDSVADYELLETLLTYAIPRRDVKPQAKAILQDKYIRDMVEENAISYTHIDGIGPSSSWYCSFLVKLAELYSSQPALCDECDTERPLASFVDVKRYLQHINIYEYESGEYIIYLDREQKVIAIEKYPYSEENSSFMTHILEQKASAIIMVNKISGENYAIEEKDVAMIKKRERALLLFSITLLDYILCTPSVIIGLYNYNISSL